MNNTQRSKSSVSFSAAAPSRRSSQRQSIFQRARMSFARSNGKRGASVEQLRGTTGADMEVTATVTRLGATGCFCFGGAPSNKNVVVIVKGPFLFVYVNESSKSPLYAISLAHMKAKLSQEKVVQLCSSLGDPQYELEVSSDVAESLVAEIDRQAAAGEVDLIRKRLGHEHLLNKRASLRYAESIATKKVSEQPEAPISAGEVLSAAQAATGTIGSLP